MQPSWKFEMFYSIMMTSVNQMIANIKIKLGLIFGFSNRFRERAQNTYVRYLTFPLIRNGKPYKSLYFWLAHNKSPQKVYAFCARFLINPKFESSSISSHSFMFLKHNNLRPEKKTVDLFMTNIKVPNNTAKSNFKNVVVNMYYNN